MINFTETREEICVWVIENCNDSNRVSYASRLVEEMNPPSNQVARPHTDWFHTNRVIRAGVKDWIMRIKGKYPDLVTRSPLLGQYKIYIAGVYVFFATHDNFDIVHGLTIKEVNRSGT